MRIVGAGRDVHLLFISREPIGGETTEISDA